MLCCRHHERHFADGVAATVLILSTGVHLSCLSFVFDERLTHAVYAYLRLCGCGCAVCSHVLLHPLVLARPAFPCFNHLPGMVRGHVAVVCYVLACCLYFFAVQLYLRCMVSVFAEQTHIVRNKEGRFKRSSVCVGKNSMCVKCQKRVTSSDCRECTLCGDLFHAARCSKQGERPWFCVSCTNLRRWRPPQHQEPLVCTEAPKPVQPSFLTTNAYKHLVAQGAKKLHDFSRTIDKSKRSQGAAAVKQNRSANGRSLKLSLMPPVASEHQRLENYTSVMDASTARGMQFVGAQQGSHGPIVERHIQALTTANEKVFNVVVKWAEAGYCGASMRWVHAGLMRGS